MTDDNKKEDIVINLKSESELAQFIKRPVATEKQVEEFEEYLEEKGGNSVNEEADEEEGDFDTGGELNGISDEEIEESLEEIYQDDKGNMVDVQRMQILGKRGIFFWFFSFLVAFCALASLVWAGYGYYLNTGLDATDVGVFVKTESEVLAGQEFFYEISAKNNLKVAIRNPRLELVLPEDFVLLDSFPASKNVENRIWELEDLPPGAEGTIKLKGMMIAPKGKTGVAIARLLYAPENFSSEFRKESSATTLVKDTGIDVSFSYIKTALLNEANRLDVNYGAKEKNYFGNFRLTIEQLENVTIALDKAALAEDQKGDVEESRPGVYIIKQVPAENGQLPINITFKSKNKDQESILLRLEKADPMGEFHVFFEERLQYDVLKSDLNLSLIVNGERGDKGVNFGDTLNYSLVYNNKGETALNDVVVMVVISGDFLDWTTLEMPVKGREKGNTITWTKEEVPELASLERHEEGVIDFSIRLMDVSRVEPGKKYEVSSFAQYSVGRLENGDLPKENPDNRSNAIQNKINSDLKLEEQLRYFNDDNITVGNGPLPLKVGEKTSFKVYWSITNNLHELEEVKVEVSLPAYVEWDQKNRTNVGEVRYDQESRKVVWELGRLPVSVFRADAEFNISVVPGAEDAGKIMVLKPGSKISAVDSETKDRIEKISEAKTSKLEDDAVAEKNNDGVVRE